MGAAEQILDVLSWASIIVGSVFCVIGAIGVVRMPDVFTRMHAASLIETMGAAGILLGLGIQAGLSLVSLKLFIIFAFLFFTNPTTTHALARALYHAGVIPVTRFNNGDQAADDKKEAEPSTT
ncbi:MAG: monovalent cation/H(+) antiporter subunit G [Rhodospirillales bacterium]